MCCRSMAACPSPSSPPPSYGASSSPRHLPHVPPFFSPAEDAKSADVCSSFQKQLIRVHHAVSIVKPAGISLQISAALRMKRRRRKKSLHGSCEVCAAKSTTASRHLDLGSRRRERRGARVHQRSMAQCGQSVLRRWQKLRPPNVILL